MDNLRLFTGVPVPFSLFAGVREQAAAIQESAGNGVLRLVAPEDHHVTLEFLGDTPREQIPKIVTVLGRATEAVDVGSEGIALTTGAWGVFPPNGRPRTVWIGVLDPSGMLSRLQQALRAGLDDAGFGVETRSYVPHVTVGYVRRKAGEQAVRLRELTRQAPGQPISWHARRAVLYESRLSAEGSSYREITAARIR